MTVIIYLVIINIISYLLYRSKKTNKNKLLSILTIISLLGGNIGVLLCILIKDRKLNKDNALLRIIVINVTIIQIFLLLKNYNLINNIINYLKELDIIFIYYLIFINIISLLLFAIDKYSAIKDKNRIRISTLIKISYLGGIIGTIFGMYIFHHKTKKEYFRYGIPLITITYLIILYLIYMS